MKDIIKKGLGLQRKKPCEPCLKAAEERRQRLENIRKGKPYERGM